MRSLEQRARARLGESVRGFELDWVEDTDVLTASFSGRGEAGMASIFILHPRFALLPGFSTGFSRAAWLSQTIEHSIVPRVLDSGITEDQLPFVVLEFVGGETLARYLERRLGTIPPAEALRIGAELGAGLAALAERGAVHGAVQPSSVALIDNGAVRLLHTGWTRLRQQAAAHLGASSIPGLSGYLSPAQARGEPPSARDDVWSLAAIVFELLSGVALRKGETDEKRLREAQRLNPPCLADVVPGAPAEIVELMDRALAPRPFETQDFAEAHYTAAEFAARCRNLALFPHISRMRRLTRQAPTLGKIGRRAAEARFTTGAPSHSGVAALDLPAEATGTAESRPSRAFPMRLNDAGTYSSHGDEQRVETLFPKKR